MSLDHFPHDYLKFLKAWHYHRNTELVPLQQVSKDMAATADFTVEFDFTDVPDLPFVELVTILLKQLPKNFIFINSRYKIITNAVKNFCQNIDRSDIRFIEIDGDIDAAWWEHAKEHYFVNDPLTLHEMSTVARACRESQPCGRIGHFVGFHDVATMLKTSTAFHGNIPNWQIVFPYNELPILRQVADLGANFVAPNFTLLLLRAFLKEVKLNSMSHVYRMFIISKIIGPVVIAVMLSPTTRHDLSSMNINTPPFYPGLIVRELQNCHVPPNIIFEEN